jgi:hypothetical protein
MVITTTIRTASHANNPSWIRHLIVDLSQSRRHLVCECAGDNHNVGLTRRGTENDTETILVVAGSREVHHFDGAASQSESHGPQGGLAGPVSDLVERGAGRLLVYELIL